MNESSWCIERVKISITITVEKHSKYIGTISLSLNVDKIYQIYNL